jgi:hypothetical protein
MKYEVVAYENDKDNLIYETDDFQEAILVTKSFANNNHLEVVSKIEVDNVLMFYKKTNESKIIKAVGLYENK